MLVIGKLFDMKDQKFSSMQEITFLTKQVTFDVYNDIASRQNGKCTIDISKTVNTYTLLGVIFIVVQRKTCVKVAINRKP